MSVTVEIRTPFATSALQRFANCVARPSSLRPQATSYPLSCATSAPPPRCPGRTSLAKFSATSLIGKAGLACLCCAMNHCHPPRLILSYYYGPWYVHSPLIYHPCERCGVVLASTKQPLRLLLLLPFNLNSDHAMVRGGSMKLISCLPWDLEVTFAVPNLRFPPPMLTREPSMTPLAPARGAWEVGGGELG